MVVNQPISYCTLQDNSSQLRTRRRAHLPRTEGPGLRISNNVRRRSLAVWVQESTPRI